MAAIVTAEEHCRNEQHKRRDDAAFRADDAAGEPCGAGECRMQKIVIGHDAAVGNAVESGLSPIISEVKADGAPEAAGGAQEKAQKQAKEHDGSRAGDSFVRVQKEMAQTEESGKQDAGGPKADAGGESVLSIPAEGELFEKSGEEECAGPCGER